MSVPSNVTRIDPTIPIDQGIYEISTTKKCPVGTRIQVGDRVFRYALAAGTIPAGIVALGATAIASNCAGICTIKTAATTGANVISVSVGTAVTLDQYAEGYLMICDSASAGGGQTFKIKSHPAVATNTSGNFTLYDTIPGAIAAQSASLIPCLYSSVAVGSAAAGMPAGVTPITVTSGSYFWLQTWGPAGALAVGANTAVWGVQASSAGLITQYVAASASGPGLPAVGIATIVGSANMACPLELKLNP